MCLLSHMHCNSSYFYFHNHIFNRLGVLSSSHTQKASIHSPSRTQKASIHSPTTIRITYAQHQMTRCHHKTLCRHIKIIHFLQRNNKNLRLIHKVAVICFSFIHSAAIRASHKICKRRRPGGSSSSSESSMLEAMRLYMYILIHRQKKTRLSLKLT